MTFPPERIGDKGQRYEVQGLRRDGTWQTVGWAETDAPVFADAVILDPKYIDVRVIDRAQEPECPALSPVYCAGCGNALVQDGAYVHGRCLGDGKYVCPKCGG